MNRPLPNETRFTRYYRTPLLIGAGIGVFFLFIHLFATHTVSFQNIFNIMGICLLFACLFGGVSHWHNEYHAPKRIDEILDRLTRLERLGFERSGIMYLGTYRGYPMSISPTVSFVPYAPQTEQLLVLIFGSGDGAAGERKTEHAPLRRIALVRKEEFVVGKAGFTIYFRHPPSVSDISERLDSLIKEFREAGIDTVETDEEMVGICTYDINESSDWPRN